MSGRSPWVFRLVAAALLASGAFLRVTAAGAREPQPAPANRAYAGAAACAPCHEAAYRGWAAGNHALSTVEAKGDHLPPEAKAGGTVSHPPGATTFHASGARATL